LTVARHFQWRVGGRDDARAVGTPERDRRRLWNHFSRPYGTGISVGTYPGVETPGYYQASLWDAAVLALLPLTPPPT
jgi:hypothetical protein